jgi:hypothetical protein
MLAAAAGGQPVVVMQPDGSYTLLGGVTGPDVSAPVIVV